MRAAVVVLLFAVVCLTASSFAWLRATGVTATLADGTGASLVAEFERTTMPASEIDLASRYGGRYDLIDPRLALPAWHRAPRDEAASVFAATKQCPPPKVTIHDAALMKAWAWHEATCAAAAKAPEALIDRPPFMHPSGKSYAMLARSRGPAPSGVEHATAFHVLELGSIEATLTDPVDRALAAIREGAWASLARGDRLVLTATSLIVAEQGMVGLSKIRVYPREAWEMFARRAAIVLTPRTPSSLCARPASAALCWQPRTAADRDRPLLLLATGASSALVVAASIALAVTFVADRRRRHADRIHVLRTLTHELRTPATSLRLDIEPLRAAYDELPASCQEPLLRISDGIERLHRVLHRSARYMALFETQTSAALVRLREVSSAGAMFEAFSEEWPEGVSLRGAEGDRAIVTDPEWLGVAVRNLVENGVRHGEPPVAVIWSIERDMLRVRVTDAGTTSGLSLRRAIAPHERDPASPGLGLGLAIAARVASLLDGRLVHEPSPTVFELRVPIGPAAPKCGGA